MVICSVIFIDRFSITPLWGDIILLGDFNACTGIQKTPAHDLSQDEFCLCKLDLEELGLSK
jgi:hypothetical protein